jgi:hypothetical protein
MSEKIKVENEAVTAKCIGPCETCENRQGCCRVCFRARSLCLIFDPAQTNLNERINHPKYLLQLRCTKDESYHVFQLQKPYYPNGAACEKWIDKFPMVVKHG